MSVTKNMEFEDLNDELTELIQKDNKTDNDIFKIKVILDSINLIKKSRIGGVREDFYCSPEFYSSSNML